MDPRREDNDLEAGRSSFTEYEDPFDIASTKNAPVERLRHWREAALVLNASRRFRYTLDLKREEDKKQMLRKIGAPQNIEFLQEFGGVKGLSDLLKTNLEKGIHGDDDDISRRKSAYGSNTYPQKKGRSFWRFVWEASQDPTLIILIVAAVASLALGIKTEVFNLR